MSASAASPSTQIETIIQLEVHDACQCMLEAFDHRPGRCWRDAKVICAKCGRQVCRECAQHDKFCLVCEDKR